MCDIYHKPIVTCVRCLYVCVCVCVCVSFPRSSFSGDPALQLTPLSFSLCLLWNSTLKTARWPNHYKGLIHTHTHANNCTCTHGKRATDSEREREKEREREREREREKSMRLYQTVWLTWQVGEGKAAAARGLILYRF